MSSISDPTRDGKFAIAYKDYLKFLDCEQITEARVSYDEYLWDQARLEYDTCILHAMWGKVPGRDLQGVLMRVLCRTIWDWDQWDGIKPVNSADCSIENLRNQPYDGLQELEAAHIIYIWNGRVSINMSLDEWQSTGVSGEPLHKIRQHFAKQASLVCHYCGITLTPETFELDHVMPRSRGGRNFLSNLVVACKPCNIAKYNRTPEEWLHE